MKSHSGYQLLRGKSRLDYGAFFEILIPQTIALTARVKEVACMIPGRLEEEGVGFLVAIQIDIGHALL